MNLALTEKQKQIHLLKNFNIQTPPIKINVDVFEKNSLKIIGDTQLQLRGGKIGAQELDYPWGIDLQNKEGKNFLNYQTQSIQNFYNLEIEHLQDNGYLFMWTVAQQLIQATAFMQGKGYRVVDSVVWIKEGKHSKFKNRMGFHLRHNKVVCLVGLKGTPPAGIQPFTASDIIKSIPGKNSKKPREIKDIIKTLLPNEYYCEVFAGDNNVCEEFVSIGNELTTPD
ncbi:MT-A70 family protein [Oxytricha trifallax]|uniref:mRNA m(6)A methyltransferase n=1 Tax=Oxytricha trifallax TaxID=1172189 RepID=A0A073HYA8_9SPIT|nr:MT-A70 family protein [Oxytricha trifallax]